MCRQCIDSGSRYGQRKKTRELIAWAKKKRRHIKREELIAFLMDKPDPPPPQGPELASPLMEESRELSPMAGTPLSGCFSNGASPRRRMVCRDDAAMGDSEMFSSPRDLARKRQQPTTQFSFDPSLVLECPPFAKRIRF